MCCKSCEDGNKQNKKSSLNLNIKIIILNTLGIDAGDSIQLAVKIAYPKEEIAKKTRVRIF